jgi:cytochrome c556
MKRIPWITAGLIAATLAGAVAAADMAGAVQARQAHFKEIGKAAKGTLDALNSPAPSVAAIQANARQIDQLAGQLPSWFPTGSGAEAGVKTGAKPEIWTHGADFHAAASAFAQEAHKFDTVAAAGDINAIRTEFGALGKTCKTCHDQFRLKD